MALKPTGLLVPLPITVNLMTLASSLEARGISRKMAGALRTAWRAQSCFADLCQAQGACDALDALAPTAAALEPGTLLHIQTGVLATAILLYARATTTSSSKRSERGSVQLDLAKLTPQQLDDHNTLVRVRNGALGHVESGAKIGRDYWHRDFLFAKRSGLDNWEVASASTSIGFHIEIFETLKRQLPIASEQLEAKCRERIEGAMVAIRELKLRDADLLRYQVDPVQWFGSFEAAWMALKTGSGESASGWTPLI